MYSKFLTMPVAALMLATVFTPQAHALDAVQGYSLFHTYCFVCHGVDGKGDGPLVKKLANKPANLARSAEVKKKSDKELFQIIQGTAPHGSMNGDMPGWGLTLPGPQIDSLVAYIRFLNRAEHELPGDPEEGAQLYKKSCSACHGIDGKGNGPMTRVIKMKPADHTDAARMSKHSNAQLARVIKDGSTDASLMPGWDKLLDDDDIEDLVSYIRLLSAH